VLIAASPWLLGFAENGQRHWLPHALMGTSEVLKALMNKTRQERLRLWSSRLSGTHCAATGTSCRLRIERHHVESAS
jgi:hypothetical protein